VLTALGFGYPENQSFELTPHEDAITRAPSSKNRTCDFHRIRLKHFVTLSVLGQQFSDPPSEFPQVKVFIVNIRIFIELQTDMSDNLRI
jgi:hypothetical protein